ncbi:MAG TPA: GNAT family N-acetyltransferase [Chloroflexota bacterium]|nr:GNAT family N-acetyltransferase [Chloroflexota bacterium]
MSFELRPIVADEFLAFGHATGTGFGDPGKDEEIEEERPLIDLDRTLAAFDGSRIVGTGVLYSFELTLPGATRIPAGGVSWISVLPTHRRRGILTAIMRRQLADMRERGEPVGLLYASESVIYGRFGFGVSTMHTDYEIGTHHARFAHHPPFDGVVEFIDREEASSILPEVWDRAGAEQPGFLTRSRAEWDYYLRDPARWAHGASKRFYVVYRAQSGEVDGYAAYRIKENWTGGFAENSLQLVGLIALNDAARTALWKYVLSVDLVTKVEAHDMPNDDPIRWMLADPRRLRVKHFGDSLWTRVIDIPAALSARRYAAEGSLTLEVHDRFCPENSGTYRLEGGADGATCARSSVAPDLTMEAADLGAAYLGGTRFTDLARAGRVFERSPGAVRRADGIFQCIPAPWCPRGF